MNQLTSINNIYYISGHESIAQILGVDYTNGMCRTYVLGIFLRNITDQQIRDMRHLVLRLPFCVSVFQRIDSLSMSIYKLHFVIVIRRYFPVL